jgi:lipopolysaccharide export system protein LptA
MGLLSSNPRFRRLLDKYLNKHHKQNQPPKSSQSNKNLTVDDMKRSNQKPLLTNWRRWLAAPALALLLAAASSADTLENSSVTAEPDQPIKIQADSAIFDEQRRSTEYLGSVIMRQGSLRITAEKITILNDEQGVLELIASGGPVRYNQSKTSSKPSITAEANRIHYFKTEERMELTGNAFLEQDGQSFSAPRIEYMLEQQTLKALGGTEGQNKGRVMMVIPPRAEQ